MPGRMDWQLAIVVAAVVFGLFVFYRFRPLLGGRAGGPVGVELKEARAAREGRERHGEDRSARRVR